MNQSSLNQTFIKDVKTPENTQWWRRLLGYLIDGLPFYLISLNVSRSTYNEELQPVYFLIFYSVYCLLFEGFLKRTIGKLITGTIVISSKTFGEPTFWQILARTFSRFIPFDLFSFVDQRPRGWHDSISKTMVVNIKDIKAYHTSIKESRITLYHEVASLFKKLPKGIYRLTIVGSIVLPLITLLVLHNEIDEEPILLLLIPLFVWTVYGTTLSLILWVLDGFKNDS